MSSSNKNYLSLVSPEADPVTNIQRQVVYLASDLWKHCSAGVTKCDREVRWGRERMTLKNALTDKYLCGQRA